MTEEIKRDRLLDSQIEKYEKLIVIKSLFDENDGKYGWAVCCKKCGGSLFPFNKEMPPSKVDDALKEHQCLEITGLKKKDNKNGRG